MLDQEGRGAARSPVCLNLKPITSFVFEFDSSVENVFREIIERNIGKAPLAHFVIPSYKSAIPDA
jgi:hypothetical protein